MNRHILIVEDEEEIRESIAEILTQSGYKVTSFGDVDGAEEYLKDGSVDLILSDILLPGKTGWDLINYVKSKDELSTIPFIFLTAKSEPSELRAGMNFGADDYITKPFRSKDLLASIKLRLEKKRNFDDKINYFLKSVAEYVPHELRTPLVSILGFPEYMLDNYESLDDEDIKNMLRNIFEAGKRMQETVEKFILYSELESVNLSEKVQKIYAKHRTDEIEGVIKQAAEKVADKYKRQQDLSFNITNHPIKIADYLLTEVIKQVIDNAFKFSASGSKVSLGSSVESNYYILNISDKGKGMSTQQVKEIDAFIQFERDNFNQGGNGLGLALTKKILSLNENKLLITSEPDKGTTASIYFKIA